jgi:TRAP transporter TAXI family solute receptor
MKKILLMGFGILICALFLQSTILLSNNAYAEVKQLSMGTATVGGIFHNVGSPLAQCVNKALPEVNITAEFTQGSTENLRLIGQKKMQLAVITPAIGNAARKGIRMFKDKPVDFRVVVRLLPNANIWATLAKSKIKDFADFKGNKIAVGPASGGLGVIARTQLDANGINYKKDI